MDSKLERAIHDKSAIVGVIGLGYVGLPLINAFTSAGFRAIGFDVDRAKVDRLKAGQSYIKHLPSSSVARWLAEKKFEATDDMSRLREPDALLICVPTPLSDSRDPDLRYVENTAKSIAAVLRPGQLVVLESTTYPTTTRDVVLPILQESGLRAGQDFFLAYSPEREDPGNPDFTAAGIPKVVGGLDEPSLRLAQQLYSHAIVKVVPVSSPEVAEACKILENTYRAVNIALVNELKVVFDRMGINVWEVIEAAKTKPFGYMPFYPGPGLGGHCIPLDPFYLSYKAAEFGVWARFIELAGEVNASMPRYVVQKTMEALNDHGKAMKGAKILCLGLSYKADIDDDRESPSFEIIEMLEEKGAQVDYCDPYIPEARPGRHHDLGKKSVGCDSATFARYDAVVVLTAHSDFKDQSLYRDAKLVIDTRNILEDGHQLVRA